jgi:DNA replication ATP-dependent helicase Dna2
MNGNDDGKVDAGGDEVTYVMANNSNDMTQDVIEWDESNNVDLRYLVPSPHPSEFKSSTPRTDSSKKSSNSSLFFEKDTAATHDRQQAFNKVNLDGSFQQVSDAKPKEGRLRASKRRIVGADQEIDGILGIIQKESQTSRTASDPNDPENDSVPLSDLPTQLRHNKRRASAEIQRHRSHPRHHIASSFSLRNRRQYIDLLEQQHPKQKRPRNTIRTLRRSRSLPDKSLHDTGNKYLTKTPLRQNSTPTASWKNDGFLELLEALTTPSDTAKKRPPRPPLGCVNKNIPQTHNTKTDVSSSLANNWTTTPAVTDTPDIRHFTRQNQSSRVSISPAADLTKNGQLIIPAEVLNPSTTTCTHAKEEQSSRLEAAGGTDEDNEFDDVSFSANDLAVIDAFAEASLAKPCKQEITKVPTALESSKTIHIQAENNDKRDAENGSDDEFDDFPVEDIDFAQIDAMVATKTSYGSSSQNEPMKRQNSSMKDDSGEDDDEFGDFPVDMDFGKIDALVESQSADPLNAKHSSGGSSARAVANAPSKVHNPHDSDDEFDDFPMDIDFSDIDAMVENQRRNESANKTSAFSGKVSYPRFTRYRVTRLVEDDTKSQAKTVAVLSLEESMTNMNTSEKLLGDSSSNISSSVACGEDGTLRLCGEWYFTPIRTGDILHVCSLTGKFPTDKSALPITLDTFPLPGVLENDLLLVLHPDKMMSPSIISEVSFCNRRAVLKAKLGSTGLTSMSALVGTLVHGLFEKCLTSNRFDTEFARDIIGKALRENAECLIGCNVSEHDVKKELLDVVPAIQDFVSRYTTMICDNGGDYVGGVGMHPDVFLKGRKVHSVEEGIISTELGLKGSIDAVLEAEIAATGDTKTGTRVSQPAEPQPSLVCLELKTGHNQTAQNAHLAQLSLYTLMLQSRYGSSLEQAISGISKTTSCVGRVSNAAQSGVLLYLNQKARSIYHIAPSIGEVKSLMGHRNIVVDGLEQACIPRGISLSYDEGGRGNDFDGRKIAIEEATPAILPDLKDTSHSCKRCFSNRECMLYAASGSATDTSKHSELMSQFTGHLHRTDLEYFRTWDRLIDIEADSTSTVARYLEPKRFEQQEGSVFGLVFDRRASYCDSNGRDAIVCFHQPVGTQNNPVDTTIGANVVVSTEALLTDETTSPPKNKIKFRRQSHVLKGTVNQSDGSRVSISCTSAEFALVEELVRRHHQDTLSELCFCIDTHARSVGTGILRWNLVNFLTEDSPLPKGNEFTPSAMEKKSRLPWLRDIIIRLSPPEFDDGPPPQMFVGVERHIPGCHLTDLSQEFASLNEAQQRAVRKCMSSRDYTLIQGLPGTGKSSILTFLARLLAAQGKRVLISAYTHSAVDNIMLKLIEKGMGSLDRNTGMSALVRLGQNKSCHKDIEKILHSELAKGLTKSTEAEEDISGSSASSLQKIVSSARIVGVTALSLPRSAVLRNEDFDVVILDEAGQISQPAALGPLMAAKLFILVGDHKQLPPLVNSEIAEQAGYGISMLSRLAEKHPTAIAPLTMQYRMNEEICDISSVAFYSGKMKCGDDSVKHQRLDLPGFPSNLVPSVPSPDLMPWLCSAINPQSPVVFVDTDQIRKTHQVYQKHDDFDPLEGKLGGRNGGSTVNTTESSLVLSIIDGLVKCGLKVSDVGVISPFRAQIKVLEGWPNVREWKCDGLELSTIDKYQGRDKSAIILSMVRSNKKGNTGRLLQDPRRLNVALTRAKHKMIIVGSFKTLCSGSPQLKPILYRMDQRNQRIVVPDAEFRRQRMN